MSNIFESAAEKLGISKDTITEQAGNLLDQNRDKIPDPIEGKIDEALHGGLLDGVLEKVGLGGHKAEAASTDEDESEGEESEEEESEDESSEEEEDSEEESSDEEDSEETEESDDSEESEDTEDSEEESQ